MLLGTKPLPGVSPPRRSLPDAVVAFRLSSVVQRRLYDALPTSLPLIHIEHMDACPGLLSCYRSPAFLVQIEGVTGSYTLARLRRLRRQFPLTLTTGIVVDAAPGSSAEARLAVIEPSVVIPAAYAGHAAFVQAALSRNDSETQVQAIWRLTSLTVADSVATILRPAVRMAHSPISLPRLAAATKLHERSLRKYCQIHGLPSPLWIIGWARMLVIAYYLTENGRSVRSIAALLGFSSSSQLANHVHRYTGMTCSALRDTAPLTAVSCLLEHALTPWSVEWGTYTK